MAQRIHAGEEACVLRIVIVMIGQQAVLPFPVEEQPLVRRVHQCTFVEAWARIEWIALDHPDVGQHLAHVG